MSSQAAVCASMQGRQGSWVVSGVTAWCELYFLPLSTERVSAQTAACARQGKATQARQQGDAHAWPCKHTVAQ